jgi:hypothetical protein
LILDGAHPFLFVGLAPAWGRAVGLGGSLRNLAITLVLDFLVLLDQLGISTRMLVCHGFTFQLALRARSGHANAKWHAKVPRRAADDGQG